MLCYNMILYIVQNELKLPIMLLGTKIQLLEHSLVPTKTQMDKPCVSVNALEYYDYY